MTEIAFYHLQRTPLDMVLPRLLQRTLDSGKRALVLAGSDERVEQLNGALWTFDPSSWLPHGTAKDGHPAVQPVWLTTAVGDQLPDYANDASFLFLTDGTSLEDFAGFERCFDLFDGNDPAALEAARVRWKRLKDAGHALTYWQQNERGAWEKRN